jgi:protein required for attachment to host cells
MGGNPAPPHRLRLINCSMRPDCYLFCRLAIEERGVMSEIPLRHGLWLAVCDGQKALLLENEGDRTYPKLETRHKSEQKNPLSHEQGSSPSGRAFSSSGRRAAVEENDLHLQQADAFIKQFATLINLDVAAGRIGELALIAPARALGQLRSHLSESAGKILVGELARDYVKLPLYEIERMLSKP